MRFHLAESFPDFLMKSLDRVAVITEGPRRQRVSCINLWQLKVVELLLHLKHNVVLSEDWAALSKLVRLKSTVAEDVGYIAILCCRERRVISLLNNLVNAGLELGTPLLLANQSVYFPFEFSAAEHA